MPLAAVLSVADMAPAERRKEWLDAAGLSSPEVKAKRNALLTRKVPVLKDAAVIGTLEASLQSNIEQTLEIPVPWLPRDGVLQAIRAPDDGMSPKIDKGFIVIVDISKREVGRLADTLVVVRDSEGVFIRCLQRLLGQDVLMPSDPQRHPIKALDTRRHYGLVGEVVLWVGRVER